MDDTKIFLIENLAQEYFSLKREGIILEEDPYEYCQAYIQFTEIEDSIYFDPYRGKEVNCDLIKEFFLTLIKKMKTKKKQLSPLIKIVEEFGMEMKTSSIPDNFNLLEVRELLLQITRETYRFITPDFESKSLICLFEIEKREVANIDRLFDKISRRCWEAKSIQIEKLWKGDENNEGTCPEMLCKSGNRQMGVLYPH